MIVCVNDSSDYCDSDSASRLLRIEFNSSVVPTPTQVAQMFRPALPPALLTTFAASRMLALSIDYYPP